MQTAELYNLGSLGQRRFALNGERISPRFALRQEKLRIAAMTPEQKLLRDAEIAKAQIFRTRQKENSFIYRAANTGWSAVAPGPLSPIGKEFQKIILARDWNALFAFLPLKYWGRYDTLGKYSFKDINGVRTWIPFSKDDISRFVFSPYYSVQPGFTCTDAQRELGVNANIKGMVRHGQKFRKTDPRVIWPIFPGWGYGGEQRYGCEKPKKSLWVKIRKGVAIAVAIVAAVYLGPIVLDKVGGMLAGASGGSGAGAGGAGAAATTGAKTTAFISKVKNAVTVYNRVNTVTHIVQGKIPPPPIGITGGTFKAVAFNLVKQKIKDEAMDAAMEAGVKYVEKKMTEKEERAIKAEIAELQRQMAALVPKDTPIMPSPELPEADRKAIAEIQVIQAKREQNTTMAALAIGAGVILMAA